MNNELSFESIFNLGVGNKSFNIDTTPSFLSQERFDGFMDSNEADFQNSIESINFINDYEKVNDYNNKLKIKMLNKINKAYGSCNRGLESFIQSIEEETDGSSAIKSENNSESKTEQPAGTSEKKLKWYQKVWESIKKVAIAIWNAIVKVFKTILKIITFGHYGKNKKEKAKNLEKKAEEVLNKTESTNNNENVSTKQIVQIVAEAKSLAPELPSVQKAEEAVSKLENKPEIKLLEYKPIVPIVKAAVQEAVTAVSKSENNPDIEMIGKVIKESEPKIQELDKLLKDATNGKGQYSDDVNVSQRINEAKEMGQTTSNMYSLIMSLNTGYCRIIVAIENIFGKALTILKKVLTSLQNKNNTKRLITSINFRDDFYNSFKNILNNMKKIKSSGSAISYKEVYSQLQILFNDKFLNDITGQQFKKIDFKQIIGSWKDEHFNVRDIDPTKKSESMIDNNFRNVARNVDKVCTQQSRVIKDLNEKDNYEKLTFIYNITAVPEFKEIVLNLNNSDE